MEKLSDDLKRISAITDLLYEEIKSENSFPDAVPTVAMMLLGRFFAERAAALDTGGLVNAGVSLQRFTERATVILLAYFTALKEDEIKGWVDFDKYTEKIRADLKREGKL